MARVRQVSFIAVLVVILSGMWVSDASAQRRGVRVRRPVVNSRVYISPYYSYRPPYYSYWSPWYGPWPYWYGQYWYDPFGYPYWNRRYLPATGALRLQVEPRQTQVYLDGYFVGIVDDFDGMFQRLRVAPGGHEIVLHLAGHRNVTQKLYLPVGSTYNLKHRMEPLPAGTPEEALPKPDPAAAKRVEELTAPDREDRDPYVDDRRWPPRRPGDRDRDDRGDAARESRFGSLAIRVQPPDAVVVVDGTEWRGAADDEGEILIQVPAGRHRIELRRNGYDTYTTEVDVRGDETTPINVLLRSREE
jgi:hypothetical protein